jgi:hypothetical protein
MTKVFSLLLLAATLSTAAQVQAQAQSTSPSAQLPQPPDKPLDSRVPPAKPSDVDSINHLMTAIYDVISGPPGPRDWDRFRSLFVPEARLTSTVKNPDRSAIRLMSVEDFVKGGGSYFDTHPFFEAAIVNKVQRFGNIAQVFSSYESRNAKEEKPFVRGVNSMQMFYDGKRWWMLSILWDEESPNNPLPASMATRATAPVTQ